MASLADCQIIHPMESHGADLTPKSLKFGDTLSTEIWVMILELVVRTPFQSQLYHKLTTYELICQ